MPWLLFRYILRELLRILLVTSGVLVTVVAFGAAIKPLSDDQLLTASQAARYIVLAMVPMLQFVLPFAAGFAATLLGHRMSSDNEVLAISAGGVSYRRLLAPLAGLGVVLLVVMLVLTQWVIPRFWGHMQRTISADVTRLFESAIGRGEPFALGNLQIYADEMAVEELPAGADADSRMVLLRVVAAELDGERRIVTDISAGRAELYIYRRPEDTYLKLVMTDTVVYNRETGQLARTDEVRPSRAIRLGRALEDEPVTMTRPQLLRVLENPDTFSDVVEQREALIAMLRDSMTQGWITGRLAENGRIDIDQPGPEGRRYRVLADRMAGQRLLRGDGEPIVVEERREGDLTRRFRCRLATLVRVATSRLSDRRFELRLVDCEVESIVGGGSLNRRAELEIPGLAVSPPDELGLAELPSAELIAERDGAAPAAPRRDPGDVAPREPAADDLPLGVRPLHPRPDRHLRRRAGDARRPPRGGLHPLVGQRDPARSLPVLLLQAVAALKTGGRMVVRRHEGTEARRHEVPPMRMPPPCLRASVPSCLHSFTPCS
jgi:lipopolysaccharide export LptBFGC system permease protein LptF